MWRRRTLRSGSYCEKPRLLKGDHLKRPDLAFEGDIVMSNRSTFARPAIQVRLPGKEDEPSKGFRNLGVVNADLLRLLPPTDAGSAPGAAAKASPGDAPGAAGAAAAAAKSTMQMLGRPSRGAPLAAACTAAAP